LIVLAFCKESIGHDKPIAFTLLQTQASASLAGDDLADNASLSQQFLSLSCFAKRKSLRDDGLDFLMLKKVKQVIKSCLNHAGF
jgi:hypothetical protein